MAARYVPASRSGRIALLLIVVAWLLGGIAVGRGYAWSQSVGGMNAAFGGVVFGVAAVAVLVFGLATAVVERVIGAPRGSGGRATRAAIVGLIVGIAAGYGTAAATGGTYVEPIVRVSAGTMSAAITSPTATFRARSNAPATCGSVADGDAVEGVTALDLGELGDGTLRAFVVIESETRVRLELFIDAADVEDGFPPSWTGTASVSAKSPDGLAATIAFEDLRVVTDSKLPTPPPGWAGALSGSLRWACEPFE
jgi:hypothetical protein